MEERKIDWLKVFNSPFIRPKIKFYLGKVKHGTPYFFPRVWKKDKKTGYLKAKPKKIGWDFVDLGWKTKWNETDYRFEWGPLWSFVFFKWQFCILFEVPELSHYWECWLVYSRNTDKNKSVKERIQQAKEIFPCRWISYKGKERIPVCYWDLILKKKYL